VLPARHRLRTAADFSATVRGAGGARSGGRLLVVHARDRTVGGLVIATSIAVDAAADRTTAPPPPRVGFVVSKAVGGAVVRNRTKRVLRHLVAERLSVLPNGIDLVVRANPAAAAATTPELAVELDRGLGRVLDRVSPVGGVRT